MQKITPCLWFDGQAEEAVNFYCSVFLEAKIKTVTRYNDAGSKASGRPAGSVMTINFELHGQEYLALNGGPYFKFNEAVSFIVNCENQEEVDHFWRKLSEGGQEQQCGWLKDKFGLSWQIVPTILPELLNSSEPDKAMRVMEAMLAMKKIDIEKLLLAGG